MIPTVGGPRIQFFCGVKWGPLEVAEIFHGIYGGEKKPTYSSYHPIYLAKWNTLPKTNIAMENPPF